MDFVRNKNTIPDYSVIHSLEMSLLEHWYPNNDMWEECDDTNTCTKVKIIFWQWLNIYGHGSCDNFSSD